MRCFMQRLSAFLLGLAILGAYTVLPVHAQNMSDNSGVNTGANMSDMSGVSSDILGNLRYKANARYVSPAHQANVSHVAQRLNDLLQRGALFDVPLASRNDAILLRPRASTAAQQSIGSMLTGDDSQAAVDMLVTTFSQRGIPRKHAEVLKQELIGLTGGENIDPDQLIYAIAAFNQVVDDAPSAFLREPPEAFVVIHAALQYLSGEQPQ